ncbi:SRPBCC family protein [Pelagibius sp. 7325]|uniref:SRPBCC family protein n=1 Tax=Pelagibius sp. 7325 TaxID=3131994 RepID=UPI0030EC1DD6
MVRVQRSTVIDAPLAAVWEVLRDFNGHDSWHPAVTTSRLEDGRRTDQVGCVRDFRLTGGERVREQLLSLSDRDHRLRYTIVESDVPLNDYVAEVALKPVTDGNRTFWSWTSRFRPPAGRERELAQLVAEGVYEAGFSAIRALVERRAAPAATPRPAIARAVSTSGAMTGQAIVVARHGGPDELQLAQIEALRPGPGEVRLRHTAIGVNFIDVYCRSGYFKLLEPPGVPGMEAAGVIVDVGPGVPHLRAGQRVAYACPPVGAYTTLRTMKADLLVPLPDSVSDEVAAAILLKGMSAEFLLHRVHPVKAGETVLVYAPAGGVGRLLCQWASHLGARVIGATSSPQKAEAARRAGAKDVIVPGAESLEAQVKRLTGGRGADVIYDAVGRDTFDHSLHALANCGHLVSFGQASGDIGSRDIGALASNSATLSRPNFGHYTDSPEKVAAITARLFQALERGVISAEIGQRFPLAEAAEAHRALEGRRTLGATILIPKEKTP